MNLTTSGILTMVSIFLNIVTPVMRLTGNVWRKSDTLSVTVVTQRLWFPSKRMQWRCKSHDRSAVSAVSVSPDIPIKLQINSHISSLMAEVILYFYSVAAMCNVVFPASSWRSFALPNVVHSFQTGRWKFTCQWDEIRGIDVKNSCVDLV